MEFRDMYKPKQYKEFRPAFCIAGDRHIAVSGFFIVRQETGNGNVRLFFAAGRITEAENGQQQGRTPALLELNVLPGLLYNYYYFYWRRFALCW